VVKDGSADDDVYVMETRVGSPFGDGGAMTGESAARRAVACPLCSGDTELWVQDLGSAIEGASFDAYRCRACNSIFSWPLAVPAGMYDAVYRHSSQLVGYSRYARYAQHCEHDDDALGYLAGQEDVYWAVAEVLARHPESKSWRIVEIGSGLGYLTAALNTAGFDVTGLDISAEAVSKAQSRFGPHYQWQDVFEPDESFLGAFDFAILLETIEHVTDPRAFLGAVTRLLTPNGSLLVTTPNRDAHPHDAQWRTDLPPVHLFWMTEAAVTEIASGIGYSVDLVDFSEFNAKHPQTVALGNLDATPPAMLGPALEPCTAIPLRTRFMERLREFPPLAAAFRFLYDRARPNRARLTVRSFSIAAVLSPKPSSAGDGPPIARG
jgi:SAM-dependent methyltransferase